MSKKRDAINELAAIFCLKRIKGLGPVKSKKIFEVSHSFYDFCVLYQNWLTHRSGEFKYRSFVNSLFRTPKSRRRFEKDFIHSYEGFDQCFDFILNQTDKADRIGGRLLTYHYASYPKNLYNSNQSIPLLYAVGDLGVLEEEKACAVVGTRRPAGWTIENTKSAVCKLVKRGFVIVSGLAKGVDTIAHRTALESGGKTVAVLGSGIDVYYPSENRHLQNEIMKKGVVLSEYPFGMRVQSFSLKKRNKIIVGLSNFVLVTETSPKGGTMNAYLAAVEQKKTVGIFAPSEETGGNFDGNKKIEREGRTKVIKFFNGDELGKI